MRVLLTGKTSCIGGYVYNLLEKDTSVTELVTTSRYHPHYYGWYKSKERIKHVDCRLNCRMSVSRLLSEFKPDTIIHLAGLGKQQASLNALYEANTNVTINLLQYAPNNSRFIYLSTVLTHENFWNNPYILSKRAAENLVEYFDSIGRLDSCIINPCAIVGKGSTHGILPDVIRKIQSEGDSIILKGKFPGTRKPYVYAGDLAQKIYTSIYNEELPIIYYGPDSNIDAAVLAEIVMKELGITKKILFDDEEWFGDQKIVNMPKETVISKYSSIDAIKLAVKDMI